MDILKNIREKLLLVSPEDRPKGINSVLTHIEIAERYYKLAHKEKDEHYFTDVIYRTNHAFEGILKEAYEVLEEKDASKATPYEIETYLASNKVFNERVMQLFTLYRTSWRNPSTHDYQLFFNDQEAFLAIITVLSFVSILIDQVVQKLAYTSEKMRLKNLAIELKNKIENYEKLVLVSKLTEILREFSKHYQRDFKRFSVLPESELIGFIAGFIGAFEPELKISMESDSRSNLESFRPDIIISDGEDNVIIEIKRNSLKYSHFPDVYMEPAIEQIEQYTEISDFKKAVVFFAPEHEEDEIIISRMNYGKKKLTVVYSIDQETLESEMRDAKQQEEMNKYFDEMNAYDELD